MTEITRDEFLRRVMSHMDISLVEAIYRVVDELTAEAISAGAKVACSEGCSICCLQVTPVTCVEWEMVERYLLAAGRNRALRRVVDKALEVHLGYIALHGEAHSVTEIDQAAERMVGVPCAFLTEGRCGIYPVRPLSCRTMTSPVVCAPGKRTMKDSRFSFHVVATDALMFLVKNSVERVRLQLLPDWLKDLLTQHPRVLKGGSGPPT